MSDENKIEDAATDAAKTAAANANEILNKHTAPMRGWVLLAICAGCLCGGMLVHLLF